MTLPQVGLQQGRLVLVGKRAHPILDLAPGTLGQGEQRRIGLAGPTGQVDDTDDFAGDRVSNGGAGAGQAAQRPM